MDDAVLSHGPPRSGYNPESRADRRGSDLQRAYRRAHQLRVVARDITDVDVFTLMRGARRPVVSPETAAKAAQLMTLRFAVDAFEGPKTHGLVPDHVPGALRLIAWLAMNDAGSLIRLLRRGDEHHAVSRHDFFAMLDGHAEVARRAHRDLGGPRAGLPTQVVVARRLTCSARALGRTARAGKTVRRRGSRRSTASSSSGDSGGSSGSRSGSGDPDGDRPAARADTRRILDAEAVR